MEWSYWFSGLISGERWITEWQVAPCLQQSGQALLL